MIRPAMPLPADQKQKLLQSISGNVDLPIVSRKYVIGLIVTVGLVLLIPLLYLAVMIMLLVSLFVFIRNGFYVPASVMLVVMLGCIKPLLARTTAAKRPRTLRRDVEPFLYEYVDRLCDSLGVWRPTDIHISCDLNAAAEFRNGWLSGFRRRGISLHLGLPIVAGLTLRQFTGVLAHELGHFSQRTAMRLENIVRRTNGWFLQAAYERDAIDEWLTRQCARRGPLCLPCSVIRGVIWTSRQLLLAMARAGTIVSCLMSREMELNADRCEVRTVGLQTFATTLLRIRELTVAHQSSLRDVVAFYDEGRLPDDMVALAAANTAFITPKVKKTLRRMMNEEMTGLFDSHPSDRDRIREAETDGSAGFLPAGSPVDDLPASSLFGRFDEVSRQVTTQCYETLLKRPVPGRMLHPVEKLLERQSEQIDAARSLKRYFQTEIPSLRPLPIPPQSLDAPEHPDEARHEIKACRERMLAQLSEYKHLTPRYRAAEETLFEAITAQTLIQARVTFEPEDFHLSAATSDVISDKQKRAKEAVTVLAGKMICFEAEAGHRLSFAMQLMHVLPVVQKIPGGDELQFEVENLLPVAQYVSRALGELPSLQIVYYRLLALSERVAGDQLNPRPPEVLVDQMSALHTRLASFQLEMEQHLYPFDHARAETTLRAFALPQIPGARDLSGLIATMEKLQSRLVTVQMRLFARLAQAAEKVEAAIGLPPLAIPVEPSESW